MISVISAAANETYIDELLTGTKTSFKHLDVQSSEISGYSHFSYEVVTKDSKNASVGLRAANTSSGLW